MFNLEFSNKTWTFEGELFFPIPQFQSNQAYRIFYISFSIFISLFLCLPFEILENDELEWHKLFYTLYCSNRAWDSIRENIKMSAQESLGYCESKHPKPWFDEECSKLVH
jgi:hypothetical protein